MPLHEGGGKLPGKTKYSGRRRSMTRKSGHKSHTDSTGGECKSLMVDSLILPKGTRLSLIFKIPEHTSDDFIGFGGWFHCSNHITVSIKGGPRSKTLKEFSPPCWGKFGSMWQDGENDPVSISVHFDANTKTQLALWGLGCGIIEHDYYNSAIENESPDRLKRLLSNMYTFSPEAHFYSGAGKISFSSPRLAKGKPIILTLKSCNRCARFLPINVGSSTNEQNHLSFSNHCKAEHLLPCKHGGFGVLNDTDTGEVIQLRHGFQLECRFCKKFAVNAALNPQRSAAQMKEDGARRRAFELLLEDLYGGSPQMRYRHDYGSELTNDIWEKFDRECFKCGDELASPNKMNLDHTRPLALLWPLDETATALCKNCNGEKRDQPPVRFYKDDEIEDLAEMTGIPVQTLRDPSPNIEALDYLEERIDWFFDTFLAKPDMTKERDGKITGELLVKALHKVDSRRSGGARLNLLKRYETHRK